MLTRNVLHMSSMTKIRAIRTLIPTSSSGSSEQSLLKEDLNVRSNLLKPCSLNVSFRLTPLDTMFFIFPVFFDLRSPGPSNFDSNVMSFQNLPSMSTMKYELFVENLVIDVKFGFKHRNVGNANKM